MFPKFELVEHGRAASVSGDANAPTSSSSSSSGIECAAFLFEDFFDVDDGSAVDCFEAFYLNEMPSIYAQNLCPVESYWVGAVRGAGCKYAHDGISNITSRMHFESGTP